MNDSLMADTKRSGVAVRLQLFLTDFFVYTKQILATFSFKYNPHVSWACSAYGGEEECVKGCGSDIAGSRQSAR
jgi:hypothetical protein